MRQILLIVLVLNYFTVSAQYQYDAIPNKKNRIVVGSYNIKWLGYSTHDYSLLAKVIANFDVCAVQEVRHEKGLIALVEALEKETGAPWKYMQGMRSRRASSTGGNAYYESHAVLWNNNRAQINNGIQGNIWDEGDVWRNDPALFSFKSGNFDFSILSIHTRWSNDVDGTRKKEVASIENTIQHLQDRYSEKDIFVVGDFNYSGKSRALKSLCEAIEYIQVDSNPKTTFKSNYSDYASSYDHILISSKYSANEYVTNSSMALDATKFIFGENSTSAMRNSKSSLSDHLPVFAIFKTNGMDDD